SGGLGINNKGEVVGASVSPPGLPLGNTRAVLWRKGVITDLNALIPADSPLYLLTAFAINDVGEIVGFGVTSTGEVHGFLATPIHSEAGSKIAAPDAQGRTSESGQVAPPENVRNQLQRRVRFGRFGVALTGPR